MSQSNFQTTSLDPNAWALFSTTSWGTTPVSFGFPNSADAYPYSDYMFNGFIHLENPLQKLVRNTLTGSDGTTAPSTNFMKITSVASFCNIDLYYRDDGYGDISIARSSWVGRSFSYYPDGYGERNGDVWLSAYTNDVRIGTFPHFTILHELGHALGLKHGHEGDNGNNDVLPPDLDSIEFSVMTYKTHVGDDGSFFDANGPSTFMMYDILALQYMYGPNYSTNSTDTVYTWDNSGGVLVNGVLKGDPYDGTVFMTIWDGGGNDTYDLSGSLWAVKIDLAPGGWSTVTHEAYLANLGDGIKARGNIANALLYEGHPASMIENAFGSNWDDELRGNSIANHLKGNAGNDRLSGLDGNDTLEGGADNDTLIGGYGADTLDGGAGIDTADYSSLDYGIGVTLDGEPCYQGAYGDVLIGIENVIGGSGADTIWGDDGHNILRGMPVPTRSQVLGASTRCRAARVLITWTVVQGTTMQSTIATPLLP